MITYKENGKFVYVYKGNDLIVALVADRTNKENEVIALFDCVLTADEFKRVIEIISL